MKQRFCLMAQLAVLLLFVGIPVGPGEAESFLTCYKFSPVFTNERYKIATPTEAAITEYAEEVNFGHPGQFALSVIGKHVGTCGGNTVRPITGTLIGTNAEDRARLGLKSFNTTGSPVPFCTDFEISCRASAQTTFPPPVWDCDGKNVVSPTSVSFQLIQVDETQDPRCSLFEAGEAADGAAAAVAAGPATGTLTGAAPRSVTIP